MHDFATLWGPTRAHLEPNYGIEAVSGRELLLWPLKPGLVKSGSVSLLGENGTLLTVRIESDDAGHRRIQGRLEFLLGCLRVTPKITWVRYPAGPTTGPTTYFDLVSPLDRVLGAATEIGELEARLHDQVVPPFDILALDYFEETDLAADED